MDGAFVTTANYGYLSMLCFFDYQRYIKFPSFNRLRSTSHPL